jgi:hypothetical protein
MAKNIDYSKLKALSKQILECIGEYPEGENPSLPEQDNAEGDGGQDPNTKFLASAEGKVASEKVDPASSKSLNKEIGASDYDEEGVKGSSKKKKEASMAMFSANLKSKFGKY